MLSCSHWGMFPAPVWVTAEWGANRYDWCAEVHDAAWPKPAERPYKPAVTNCNVTFYGWPDYYNSDNVNG